MNLLSELEVFIETDVVAEVDAEQDQREGTKAEEEIELNAGESPEVQAKLKEVRAKLKAVGEEIIEKEKTLTKFSQAITRANTMLRKVKASIELLKSNRKKADDGIESQMYGWMKVLFRIQQPAYHGGKLIGKDSVKRWQMGTQCSRILQAYSQGMQRRTVLSRVR